MGLLANSQPIQIIRFCSIELRGDGVRWFSYRFLMWSGGGLIHADGKEVVHLNGCNFDLSHVIGTKQGEIWVSTLRKEREGSDGHRGRTDVLWAVAARGTRSIGDGDREGPGKFDCA
jgi:hypothetical protein